MAIPTEGDTFSKMMEHLRKLQEETAMMAHLRKANSDDRNALAWLAVSENFKKMQHTLTQLAMRKMQ